MGHWGTYPVDLRGSDCLIFQVTSDFQSRTNSDIRLYVAAYPVKITLLVSCPLEPNPGDATDE